MSSMFTNRRKSDAETISELRSELTRTQVKLNAESLKRAEAEANAARLQRNEILRAEPHPPAGDEDRGYRCSCCGTEIDWPFEQRYCGYCGKGIDWRTSSEPSMYDNWREYRVDENLAYDLAGDR